MTNAKNDIKAFLAKYDHDITQHYTHVDKVETRTKFDENEDVFVVKTIVWFDDGECFCNIERPRRDYFLTELQNIEAIVMELDAIVIRKVIDGHQLEMEDANG